MNGKERKYDTGPDCYYYDYRRDAKLVDCCWQLRHDLNRAIRRERLRSRLQRAVFYIALLAFVALLFLFR